jgi:hypothetical protein
MDNFLYIILGILWVVYSIYSAKKKAEQRKASGNMPAGVPTQSSPLPIPGNTPAGKVLEDIIREFTGLPQPNQKPQPKAEKPGIPEKNLTKTVYTPVSVESGSLENSFFTETSSDNTYIDSKTLPTVVEKDTLGAQDQENIQKFNLREAVIFSELLNKKYF